jgi:hypothetical protein
MSEDPKEQMLLQEYVRRVLEHLTHCDELPDDLASELVKIHMPLIEGSFRQDLPEDFCARRMQVANWKNAHLGKPFAGFYEGARRYDSRGEN